MTVIGRKRVAIVLLPAAVTATVALAILLVLYLNGVRTQPPGAIALVPASAPPAGEALPTKFTLMPLKQPRPLPELHFTDGDGRAMTFADFRDRVVLLNIWATWCVPCRKEMPALDRLQAKLGSRDFQLVPLSIDRQGLSVIKPFYQELKLKSLGIYVDQSGKAANDLGAVGIPTTLLVDRQGREIGRKVGPAEWDSPENIAGIRQYLKPPAGASQHATGGTPAQ